MEISVELYDEALDYLVLKFGIRSPEFKKFISLKRRSYKAVKYAQNLGFIDEF